MPGSWIGIWLARATVSADKKESRNTNVLLICWEPEEKLIQLQLGTYIFINGKTSQLATKLEQEPLASLMGLKRQDEE
eukprot:459976-Ditylum_brightwellii.AAC.1